MAYEFHYTPTGTGVISGKEVLEQTEDAINDLGNTAISGVQEALDKAEQALTNSENAVDDAQTALNTANNAEGVAIQAQNDVSNLSGTVTNIGNRVTTAEGNITNLRGRMTTAEGNITNLQGRMTTAEGNIGNLQTAVSTAQATANSAQQTATTARQQSYVFRYSSTVLAASSTNSNALLDNTDNLKVGDKVIDSSGVLFSITAIDTQNSTFTIGTALIDLAQDSDVVHKSGDETISGVKSFINYFWGKDLSGQTVDLNDCVDAYSGAIHYYYAVSNYTNISNKPENKPFILESKTVRYVSSIDHTYYQKIYTADYNSSPSIYTRYYRSGSASWSNWVKDTDKFVTTDTNQTISGNKTFSDDITLQGTTTPVIKTISNIIQDSTSGNETISRVVRDKTNTHDVFSESVNKFSAKKVDYRLNVTAIDNDTEFSTGVRIIADPSNTTKCFTSSGNNTVYLGISDNRWRAVYATNYYYGSNNVEFSTKFVTTDTAQTISGNKTFSSINGVEPSSLSLPSGNANGAIDISSYITALDGTSNSYTAPANGWISIAVVGTAIAIVSSSWSDSRYRTGSGNVRMLYPVLKNETLGILVTGTTLAYARFIPCQGNV